ncbi:hypothetical protein TIFTF001_012490 [Ficus carica]|uniref:Wall-associated receptor kinase galacturonan-binding domain-containing protein n=1 Tax=Ficus carica TaxID=3494 RepID=A0AA88D6B8_FICCA|nr:hypothetical protein TIFTF001_012490 [Ficus carica]
MVLLWPWMCTVAMKTTARMTMRKISSATTEAKTPPDCNRTCGNVEVPYPFGIEDPKCAKDTSFVLNSSRSNSPPQLFLGLKVQVVNISVEEATMSVVIHNVTYAGYNESTVSESSSNLLNRPTTK